MKIFLLLALLLAGCAAGPLNSAKDYRAASDARPGEPLTPEAAKRAVSGFAALYGDLSVPNVERSVRAVYADDAWFNDTIATKVGIDAIEKYLRKTAGGAEKVQARINDVAVSGSDVYVRWTMEVRAKNLAGGQRIVTEGVSQLRFDRDGRVVLHQDFWNPADGIYRHLPLLGPAIRFVNGLIVGS